MFTAKFFSGLNTNGLKYLVPLFIAPLAGVTFRVIFGAIAFWVIDYFTTKKRTSTNGATEAKIVPTAKDKLLLLLVGAIGFYMFQITYLYSVKFTTPVSITILISLLPVWTYLISWLIFRTEKREWNKIIGLGISFCAALLSIFSYRSPQHASNPILGDILAIISNIAYAVYLIYSKKLLKKFSSTALLKWSFTGAALTSIAVNLIILGCTTNSSLLKISLFSGSTIYWKPILVLLFILIFPTVLSFLLQQLGLKYLSATVVASYSNVMVVVTTITSLILGQDTFNIMQLVAILLLFLGLYFVSKEREKATRYHSRNKV